MYFMWNVIYFSERYVCLFWHKMEVAKAFLPHQWVWGWLRGFNGFATNGIDHSWLTLVIWNNSLLRLLVSWQDVSITGSILLFSAMCDADWANIVLYNRVPKEIYNFWLLVVLLLNPMNNMGCCKRYHLFALGDM